MIRVGLAPDVECAALHEYLLVAVGGRIEQDELISLVQLLVAHDGVPHDRAGHVLYGRHPPEQLLDGHRHVGTTLTQLVQLAGLVEQGQHPPTDDMASGLVAPDQNEQ